MAGSDDYQRLVSDIKENGLIEPIWLLDNKILDGRNRYKACIDAGVTPEFKEYEGDDALSFVLSLNLSRRHLNSGQCAFIALKIKPILRARKKERQKKKEKWIKERRKEFKPSERCSCFVCGSYKSVTEAHHLIPLHWQYDNSINPPIHDHVWLCPTHHKIVHLNGESMLRSNQTFHAETPMTQRDKVDEITYHWVMKYIEVNSND